MRICNTFDCSYAAHGCCADCDRIKCRNRCLNHPDRCNNWSITTARPAGRERGSVDPQEVLSLAKAGNTYESIAEQMGMSVSSVSYHLQKLGYFRKRGRRENGD